MFLPHISLTIPPCLPRLPSHHAASQPEPDESVSDEEYEVWENRNPTWQLRADLDVDYLIATEAGKTGCI
jgi:hypothetical protein